MSNKIDQKAYLQKYLTGSSGEKKKKKKKTTKGKGFKIIDDDIDLTKLRTLDGDELDIFDEGEDAPQIAGIIDDRPEELKQLERLKTSSKWKVVSQDDGFNSKLRVEEIKKDIKETEKDNELIFGKMYSDSEDEKNDSDPSPSRKQSNESQKNAKPSKKHGSDSDFSPPRKRKSKSHSNDSDASPPRKNRSKERVRKASRWGDKEEVIEIKNQSSPSSRKNSHNRRSPSSDESPPRKSKTYDSDASPPRKSRKDYTTKSDSRISTVDKRKNTKHLEQYSPTKRRKYSPHKDNHKQEQSKKRRHSSDSDISLPRKARYSPENNKRKYNDNSNQSPRREKDRHRSNIDRSKKNNDSQIERNKRRYNSDSDQSPPRRDRNVPDRDRNRRKSDSPPPTNKKMARTLDGKLAGLQDARQLRQENMDFRRREDEVFSKMSDEVSGRNARAVSRKDKRATSEEKRKEKEKSERKKEYDEKYKRWGKGLKQLEEQEARVQEFMYEASKPLARHQGDRDLEENLKQIEREGDTMLQYIRERKRERRELGPEKPIYKGNFAPNRFNIRPGYRWDGVDRSNGYEKKFFDQQSKRKAQEEEAYKWSIEDL